MNEEETGGIIAILYLLIKIPAVIYVIKRSYKLNRDNRLGLWCFFAIISPIITVIVVSFYKKKINFRKIDAINSSN